MNNIYQLLVSIEHKQENEVLDFGYVEGDKENILNYFVNMDKDRLFNDYSLYKSNLSCVKIEYDSKKMSKDEFLAKSIEVVESIQSEYKLPIDKLFNIFFEEKYKGYHLYAKNNNLPVKTISIFQLNSENKIVEILIAYAFKEFSLKQQVALIPYSIKTIKFN